MPFSKGTQRTTPRLLLVVGMFALVIASCSSDSSEPTTTFDGNDCTYVGPAEFVSDTEATFTFVNASEGTSAGYAVWKVPDGRPLPTSRKRQSLASVRTALWTNGGP
jgi:hypothetical protein